MKPLTLITTTLLLGLAMPALASDDDRRGGREQDRGARHERDHDDRRATATDRVGWLSETEVAAKLAERGLKVGRIKIEHGRFEVRAIDASGATVKTYVDPKSGEVMRREHDADRDGDHERRGSDNDDNGRGKRQGDRS